MGRPASENPTDWELVLLNILWEYGQASVDDIREILRSRGIKRSDSALRTILRIMRNKGLVRGEVVERTTIYQPAVKKPAVQKKMTRHLLNTLFLGNKEEFVLHVLSEYSASPEIVAQMETMVKDYKNRGKSRR